MYYPSYKYKFIWITIKWTTVQSSMIYLAKFVSNLNRYHIYSINNALDVRWNKRRKLMYKFKDLNQNVTEWKVNWMAKPTGNIITTIIHWKFTYLFLLIRSLSLSKLTKSIKSNIKIYDGWRNLIKSILFVFLRFTGIKSNAI